MGIDSAGEEIDFTSRASIVKGIHTHLQCPGCNKLIQDPRILACAHTYCRLCLDKAVRKHIRVLSLGPAPPTTPDTTTTATKSLEPYFLDYNLRKILGSSLNKELEESLSKILNPDFNSMGLETTSSVEKSADSKVPNSKTKKASSSKAKGGKTQEASHTSATPVHGNSSSNSSSTTKSAGSTTKSARSTTKSAGSTTKSAGSTTKSAGSTTKSAGSTTKSAGSTTKSAGSTTKSAGSTTKSAGSKSAELDSASKPKSELIPPIGPISTIEVLVCPECGANTEIPGGNISLIPYNFFMQHIMDLMTYYSSAEPVPLVHCSVCRKDGVKDLPPAVIRCSTCASFLCKQCYELHSIDDFTKLHSTLSITERGHSSIFSCLTPDDTKVRNCKTHNWKPFMYYCITCHKGICETCSKQDHESHLFAKPDFIRSDFVSYIRDLMSRTTQLRRRTENSVRTAQDLMSGIQLLGATQTEEVLRTHDVLSSALDARLSVLLQEVDKLSEVNKEEKTNKKAVRKKT